MALDTKKKKIHFIVIDDSKLDCFIADRILKNTGKVESVKAFIQATEAIDYISNSKVDNDVRTIILVDIQMPVMDGYEFLEAFQALNKTITDHYTVYLVNSSVNERDLKKIWTYFPLIKMFFTKPLTAKSLEEILN
jgi:CheY-like chemotaxis protein